MGLFMLFDESFIKMPGNYSILFPFMALLIA
jgi:hypothetical protein